MTFVEGLDVIPIPVGYFREFRSDPLDALLKYGSLPMRARAPWFTNLKTIQTSLVLPDLVCGPKAELFDPTVGHRALIGAPYRENDPGSATILLDGLAPNFVATDDGYWHVHLDLGLGKKRQGDAAGIAMGRITESYEERMLDPASGNEYKRAMRTYEVPLVAQILAPVSDQIYLGSIVRFILQLRQLRGFNITSFSSDSFQSASAGQELMLAGLVTAGMTIDPYTGEVTGLPKPFSVDRSDGPYREFLEAVNENRVRLPQYELLRKEMRELEATGPGGAPDHPLAGCFTGETRVPLLDGTTPRIEDLVDREVWVYSATPAGDFVPGRARGRLSKHVTEVVDVMLDDGRVVRCTPEHLWMLKTGVYKEAQQLVPGVDRLMPCKRSWPVINAGYEDWADWLTPRGENHRVRRVDRVQLGEPVPVYDLEVGVWSNFALDAGVFVHNSKECGDCVAGVLGYLGMFGHAELDVGERFVNRSDLEASFGIDAPTTLGPESDIDESWFNFDSDKPRLSVE
jgi:hypothetical protein